MTLVTARLAPWRLRLLRTTTLVTAGLLSFGIPRVDADSTQPATSTAGTMEPHSTAYDKNLFPSLVAALRELQNVAQQIQANYEYENTPNEDARAYLELRRCIASSKADYRELKPFTKEQIGERFQHHFGKWQCEYKVFGARFQLRTLNVKTGEQFNTLFDGQTAFFTGNAPSNRVFLTAAPIIKQPRLSDVLAKPVWSVAMSQLNPFTYVNKGIGDWFQEAKNANSLFFCGKEDSISIFRALDTKERANGKRACVEIKCQGINGNFRITEMSTFLIDAHEPSKIESLSVPASQKTTIVLSEHVEILPTLALPTIIKSQVTIRPSALADFDSSKEYKLSEFTDSTKSPHDLYNVCTQTIRIKSLEVFPASPSRTVFQPKLDATSSVHSYLLDRTLTTDEVGRVLTE